MKTYSWFSAPALFAGLTILPLAPGPLDAQNNPPVPANYQPLYNLVSSQISAFANQIPQQGSYPTDFSQELQSANSARGAALLSQSYSTVSQELDSLQATGVHAITVNVDFPILDPAFYQNQSDYQKYLDFYKRVASDVHSRGLRLIAGTGIIVDPPGGGATYTKFYKSLGLAAYEKGRADQAVTVAKNLNPDYMSVVNEPDIEAWQSSYTALGTVSGSMGLLQMILGELKNSQSGPVRVGAGVGTWLPGYAGFVQAYASTTVDYIDMHIYPVNYNCLTNALSIAALAHNSGKKVAISEAWPLKETNAEYGTITFAQAEARDIYGFWAPLDKAFFTALFQFSQSQQLLFLSPFYSQYFHAYLNYAKNKNLTLAELRAAWNTRVGQNLVAGHYTSTGQAFSQTVIPAPDHTPPSIPGSLAAAPQDSSVIELTWLASTDNVGVAGYKIFRDGSEIGTTSGTKYYDQNLTAGTTYHYALAAYDVAGNTSAQTNTVAATTP